MTSSPRTLVALGPALCALCAPWFTAPASAEVRYIAFGDSITLGTALPDFVFDGDPAADCDDPDQCGYVWRLEASLQAAGIDAEVFNHGVSGELTPEGLSRIGSVISSADEVLILMEGTNDVSLQIKNDPDALTIGQLQANLRAMMNAATAVGMDTLLSSVINRVCGPPDTYPNDCNDPPKEFHEEIWTEGVQDRVGDISVDDFRSMADPWSAIGVTQASVDANYWQPDPLTGHLDEDGYDLLAPLFHDQIVADPPPTAPTLETPIGDVDGDAVFQFNNLTSITLYQVQVDGPTFGGLFSGYFEDHDCGGTPCTVDLGPLDAGEHSWRVRSINLRGKSVYTPWTSLTVYTAPPGVPTLISPPPDPVGAPPLLVTYTWQELLNATEYRIEIKDSVGTILLENYDAVAVCAGGSCSVTPSTALDGGEYSWRLRGINPAGNGTFSVFQSFAIGGAGGEPGDTATVYPTDDIFDQLIDPFDPPFRWSVAAGATEYRVQVDGVSTVIQATECETLVCTATTGADLSLGAHSWRVRAENGSGNGNWTADQAFDVIACEMPFQITLDAGDTGGPDFDYSYCDKVVAGNGYTVQTGETVTFHTGDEIQFENGFVIETGATFIARSDLFF